MTINIILEFLLAFVVGTIAGELLILGVQVMSRYTKHGKVSIEVYQHDWIPGFAAFMNDGAIDESAKAHVVLNLGSLLSAVESEDIAASEIPYFVAESLMHEAIHALEAWTKVEFSEERVEELLTVYRKRYANEIRESTQTNADAGRVTNESGASSGVRISDSLNLDDPETWRGIE